MEKAERHGRCDRCEEFQVPHLAVPQLHEDPVGGDVAEDAETDVGPVGREEAFVVADEVGRGGGGRAG